MEKERKKKEKREISPVLGPALVQSAEGSPFRWACAPGASVCALLSSLPLLQVGTQTH